MARIAPARWLLGLFLVALGLLFLLDSTDVIEAEGVWGLAWPLLLVFVGLAILIRERGRSLVGLVVLLLGAGFFAQNADWIEEGWIGRYWPVVIIVAGLAVLVEAVGFMRPKRFARATGAAGDEGAYTAVLGGRKSLVTSKSWRGGRATAIMGGVELDLREAVPVPEGAVLDVTALMGGVEVKVPHGWRVEIRGTPLLGGFDDKTDGGAGEDAPRLEIIGTAIMGGVDVKH